MFDIGMGELGLIAVVGLLVLGPERLPRVARTAGVLVRKARQSWQSVRTDIERELAAEDLKRTLRETAAAADPGPDLRRAAVPPQAPVSAESAPHPAPQAPDASVPAAPAPRAPDTHNER
jgi:sec-independent protein translocase protein TatB